GLSLLDQAISQAAGDGAAVTENAVRDMLGLADRAKVFDLLDAVMKGDVKSALNLLADQYAAGANPIVVVQDMLELVHWLTRIKLAPDGVSDPGLAETERTRGAAMATQLSVPVLSRAWQMLIKGLSEARNAPLPLQAVEMLLIRMAYATDLPTPADALKQLESGGAVAVNSGAVKSGAAAPSSSSSTSSSNSGPRAALAVAAAAPVSVPRASVQPSAQHSVQPATQSEVAHDPMPENFASAVALFERHREIKLAALLKRNVRLVKFETGRIDINPDKSCPTDLSGQMGKLLGQWTGQRWMVSVVAAGGDKTLYQQDLDHAKADPLVASILEAFPG
ncbi:MAG: hypothetical protein KDA41_11580, partial [Planctomycetales bacterium]|nr:hypothetical protein [Planctomycetales bacterium]